MTTSCFSEPLVKFTPFALSRQVTIRFSQTSQNHLSISNSQISHFHHPLEALCWRESTTGVIKKKKKEKKSREWNIYAVISQNKLREFFATSFLISDAFMQNGMASEFENGYIRLSSALRKHILNTYIYEEEL